MQPETSAASFSLDSYLCAEAVRERQVALERKAEYAEETSETAVLVEIEERWPGEDSLNRGVIELFLYKLEGEGINEPIHALPS